ncbi:thioredoxin-disulfide reductase [Planctomycetota bacterium]
MEQMVIAGTGPAGLTAAIYAARARLEPLAIEGVVPGGQLIVSHEVENMPGFPEGIPGFDLIELFKKQAERFGARFQSGSIRTVKKQGDGYLLTTDETSVETRTLIIATGAQARRLNIPSEARFYGQGISGCATCDGAFFRDRDVLVVGGGNTAIGDALFLTRFAKTVTIVHRRDYLRAAPIEIDKARKHPQIEWMIPWVVEEVTGDKTVTGAMLKTPDTGETQMVLCGGIFVAIGHDPQTGPFRDLVTCDEHGFIQIEAGSTRTSAPGIFACGDVCDPVYKQAVVAAGLGCMAALDAQHYLEA